MKWNVIEIARNGLYVKLYRGFLLVMQGEQELGRVIVEELSCLLLTAEQATLSKPVMVRLAEEGVPVVICGNNYHPLSLCLPYGTHYQSAGVLQAQLVASLPLKKRIWQALVKAKVSHQRDVLLNYCLLEGGAGKQLERMINKVRSGDPDNVEAQAARVYWQTLFGSTFRRRTDSVDFVNRALNYGYAIMRAACARSVVAAGLHAALGLHHSNLLNPFCLVDDLMEIYRPLVDEVVLFITRELEAEGNECNDLNPEQKVRLAQLLQRDVWVNDQATTVATSMQTLAFSLVTSYKEKTPVLQMPTFGRDASYAVIEGKDDNEDENE